MTIKITPRWYCIDNIGRATLCANTMDAKREARDADRDYPRLAPHVAAQLAPVLPLRDVTEEDVAAFADAIFPRGRTYEPKLVRDALESFRARLMANEDAP